MTQLINKLAYSDDPFGVLIRNFFEGDKSFYAPAIESKIKYPVDIYESDEGLHINVAAIGLSKDDINIEIDEGDTLKISYDKDIAKDIPTEKWHHRGIAQRSFSYGLKITNKFDIDKLDANIDKGLLSIKIPIAPNKKPKRILIKNK